MTFAGIRTPAELDWLPERTLSPAAEDLDARKLAPESIAAQDVGRSPQLY